MSNFATRLESSHRPHHLSGYYGKFDDGAPGTWTTLYQEGVWKIELPNRTTLEFPKGAFPNWEKIESIDAPATTLWRNSLKYVPKLVQEDETLESATAVLRSFRVFVDRVCFVKLR